MAHINEHIAFEYRKQLEEQLGVPLPNPDEVLPEDVEVELSRLTAQAAQKLLAKDQGEVQQQQIQQQQQDPIIQMQQQELQLKAQEVQIKAQQVQMQNQLDQQKIELEKLKIVSQEKIEGARITAKSLADEHKMHLDTKLKGVEITLDAAKTQLDHEHAMEIAKKTKQQQE